MKISLENGNIKLESGKVTQLWGPKEGVTIEQVFSTVKRFVELDGGKTGRALVALKNLAQVVNPVVLDPDLANTEPAQKQAQEERDKQVNESSTEQILAPDPKADASQTPRGPAAPADSTEHPAQPSPSCEILNHDAEISLNEYMSRPTFQLNEAELNVSWRPTVQGLEVRINGQLYVYDPLDPDLTVQQIADKMDKVGKHSKGKALGWLEGQRRAGNVRSYKVKDDENSPKGWERAVEPALKEKGATDISILPMTDDWTCDFKLGETEGSINANIYSGEWTLTWGSVNEKGLGVKDLVKAFDKLVLPKKESLSEDKNTPFQIISKDKETGKDVVHSSYASEVDANNAIKDLQKDPSKKGLQFRVQKKAF